MRSYNEIIENWAATTDTYFDSLKTKATISIMVLVVTTILSIFVWHAWDQTQYGMSVYSNEQHINLTKNNLLWDVFLGESPLCGDVPCHVTADFPGTNFTRKNVLPIKEFPLIGFKSGQKIFYRSSFTPPDNVPFARETKIVLHTLYIWAKSYQVYLDGIKIAEGSEGVFNIFLPSSILTAGKVSTLGIVVDSGTLPFQGVSNLADLVIGPADNILPYQHLAFKIKTADMAWTFLPAMTSVLLVAALFIFSSRTMHLFYLGLFIFCYAMDSFFWSNYSARFFHLQTFVGSFGKSFQLAGAIFLCFFVKEFLNLRVSKRNLYLFICSALCLLVLEATKIWWGAAYAGDFARKVLPIAAYFIAILVTIRRIIEKNIAFSRNELVASLVLFSAAVICALISLVEYVCQDFFSTHCVSPTAAKSLNFYVVYAGLAVLVAMRAKNAAVAKLVSDHSLSMAAERYKAVTNAAKIIAHDIRRPLSALALNLGAFNEEIKTGAGRQSEALDSLRKSVSHAEDLANDLLLIDSDAKIPLVENAYDLQNLVNDASELVAKRSKWKPARFENHISKNTTIICDREKIIRAVSNLLENAVDALPLANTGDTGCKIKTNAQFVEIQGTNYIRVAVWNYGSFIVAEKMARIFEAFYSEGKIGGTGLGLAITKTIIKAHGGNISCASSPVNGTTFFVDLPIKRSSEKPSGEASDEDAFPAEPLNIVQIEDDEFIADAWREKLSGSHLTRFSSVEGALKFFSQPRGPTVDLILCDYFFDSGSSGPEFMYAFRLTPYRRTPVFLCSDHTPDAAEIALFDGVLNKTPIDENTLKKILAEKELG